MSNTAAPLPWFSGICLEGEVAGQYMLEACDGEGSEHSSNVGDKPSLVLDHLAPITIFVRANNSGKSRLMRELFTNVKPNFVQLGFCSPEKDAPEPSREMSRLISEALERERSRQRRQDHVPLPSPHHDSPGTGWYQTGRVEFLEKHLNSMKRHLSDGRPGDREGAANYGVRQKWEVDYEALRQKVPRVFQPEAIQRCYVPILRGMRPPFHPEVKIAKDDGKALDAYLTRAIGDYFEYLLPDESYDHYLKHEQLHIFTGLSLYSDLQERMLSPEQDKRQSILDYQTFLSKHFFAGQPVLLVPALKKRGSNAANDVVYLKIGDKDEYPIHELGDGMQSLIICTYPIITETRSGSLFFFEEPDLGMHPSMQRTLLDVLQQYHHKMGHQFFLTTHSNHLLDLVDNPDLVSILTFAEITDAPSKRVPEARVATTPSGGSGATDQDQSASNPPHRFRIRRAGKKDRELLLPLCVRPSATFLANATIWVEGISDASYLRAYLEVFVHYLAQRGGEEWNATAEQLRQYKEDNHYAFVEYSGANLSHFSFEYNASEETSDGAAGSSNTTDKITTNVDSLCAHAIVIADGDIVSKGNRLDAFRQQLKERLIVLPGKEIENLIPELFVKEQVKDDHSSSRYGNVSEDQLLKIRYADYSRRSASDSLVGLGGYLFGLGISKYGSAANKSATLPTTYKSRWSSSNEGIPWRV